MSVKSAQAVTVLFATANATTGAAADASSTPTGTLYVNGTANGATVTVTNITTGLYKAAMTLPSLTAGDVVSLRIAATVATVAGEGVVWQDVSDTKRASDLNDIAATAIVSAGAITTSSGAVSSVTTVGSVSGAVGSVTGAVGSVTGAVGSVTGAVGSVTGNVGGSVASVAANGITATSIATDAINAAAVKADAVTKIQAGLATPTNITAGTITTATNVTTVNGLAANVITAASIAAGAIDNATFAADVGSTAYATNIIALAADKAIANAALATAANLATVAGYLDTEVAAILADTNELQTDLVNGGRLDLLIDAIKAKTDNLPASPAAVGSAMTLATGAITAAVIATNAIDADALAADAVTEIAAGITIPSAATIADAVLDEASAGHSGFLTTLALEATAQSVLTDTGTTLDTLIKDIPTNAELATALGTADDATLAAIAALSIPAASAVADAVWDEALAGHAGAGSAGLALATASSGGVDPSVLADAIWDEALSGHSTAGTSGKKLTDLANADLSGVATAANLAIVDGIVDDILVDTGTTLPATLAGLATATALTTVAGYIDTEVAAILAAVDTEIAAILEDTGTTLPASLAALATSAAVAAVKAILDKLDTALELDGAVYRFTVNALELGPAGGAGGTSDWTAGEREQIRHRLGVDGDVATPATNAPHLGTVDANIVEISGDATAADNLESYSDGTLPFPAHVPTIRR